MSRPFELPTLTPVATLRTLDGQAARQSMLDDAVEQGRSDGYAAGLEAGRAELAGAISALQQAAAELRAREESWCDALEPAAVDLIVAGVEQIVGEAVALQPQLIEPTVRVALRRIVHREAITVLVNPSDLERVQQQAGDLATQLGGIERLEVQAELRVSPGGVVVETPEGDVDASLETRLDRFAEVVRDALAS